MRRGQFRSPPGSATRPPPRLARSTRGLPGAAPCPARRGAGGRRGGRGRDSPGPADTKRRRLQWRRRRTRGGVGSRGAGWQPRGGATRGRRGRGARWRRGQVAPPANGRPWAFFECRPSPPPPAPPLTRRAGARAYARGAGRGCARMRALLAIAALRREALAGVAEGARAALGTRLSPAEPSA